MADIELTQAILGLTPYVLMEFVMGDEGDEDLRIKVNAGGGISTPEDIKAALEMALANFSEAVPQQRGTDG